MREGGVDAEHATRIYTASPQPFLSNRHLSLSPPTLPTSTLIIVSILYPSLALD